MKNILCVILSFLQILFSVAGITLDFGQQIPIVSNGKSDYSIIFDSDTSMVAAFTVQERIAQETGVNLSISNKANDNYISFELCEDKVIGNYGYKIYVDNKNIIVNSASLAGFDMAIEKLLENTVSDKSLKINEFYTSTQKLNWESDYKLNSDDYNPEYLNDTFYNDKNDSVAYVANAMWHMFGLVDDGQDLVYRFGNEPTYFEWISEKIAWSNDTAYKNELKEKIRIFPQTSTGYMWSWITQPYWPAGKHGSLHYDGTFRYISSVFDIISWENNTDFLYSVDDTADNATYSDMDASYGKTVLEKTESCMDYILNYLNGKNGYILNTVESTYLNDDGSLRFDHNREIDEYIWDNTGRNGSSASNYWDNLCFGHLSAYENALFYQALNSMSGIYRMLGKEYSEKANTLDALAETVKGKFNELFWSEEKGRYIACIDADGNKIDYGFTFLNFEIMKYGLVDEEQSKLIFSWIDGERIINGEDKTGDEIMSYAEIMKPVGTTEYLSASLRRLRLAAATNTVSINNAVNKETGIAWWDAPETIDVWTNAAYGKHLENGGYIFYPVFYELMSRTSISGAQSTTERFADIARVYEYNRLKSDVEAAVNGVRWIEGLNEEFPESGLVPTAYLYSFIGANAKSDGLYISPKFNNVYEFMGVENFVYGGNCYSIEVNRNSSLTLISENGNFDMPLKYIPERFTKKTFKVTVVYSDATLQVTNILPDETGTIQLNIKDSDVTKITLEPILTY